MLTYQRPDCQRILITGIIIIFGLIGILKIILMLPSRINQNDFAHYYTTSRALIEGENVYQTNLQELYKKYGFIYSERISRPTNPPLLIWFFSIFASMPPNYAYWGWAMFQAFCVFVILWLMKRILKKYQSPFFWPLTSSIFIISSGLYFNFIYSQIQLVLLILILSSYLLFKQKMHLTAIFLTILAGMLKLFPFVFLPWFILRASQKWQKRIFYTIYSLLLIFLILLISGPRLWIDFISYGIPIIRDAAFNAKGNYSIPSLIINIGFSFHEFAPSHGLENFLIPFGLIAGGSSVLLCYVFLKSGGNHDVEVSLLFITSIISSITCWPYYLVFLVFPLSVAFFELDLNTSSKRILFMIISTILITAGIEMDLFQGTNFNPLQLIWYHLPSFAMLVLAWWFFKKMLSTEGS